MQQNIVKEIDSLKINFNKVNIDESISLGELLSKLAILGYYKEHKSTKKELLSDSLNYYLIALQIDKKNMFVLTRVLSMYIKIKDYDSFYELISQYNFINEKKNDKLMFFEAEYYFINKDFEKLIKISKYISEKDSKIDIIKDVVSLWKNL